MNTTRVYRALLLVVAVLAVALSPSVARAGATITIVNNNAPGVGFNDPTPAAPVGGNMGTTLGEQRLIAFQHAADIWGATLDSSVEIQIRAAFVPLSCTATSGVLGSAGAVTVSRDFPAAPLASTWYSAALANKLSFTDRVTSQPDINANFNVNLGNPGCLTGTFWYLGLDANHGTNIDLVTVLLHEFAHGLGFQTFTSGTSGNFFAGFPTVYDYFLFDTTANLGWTQMTAAQRVTSAINSRGLVWTGPEVDGAAPGVLTPGTPLLRVNTPAVIAGVYAVGTATFGSPLASPGITGDVVQALDAANASGPTMFDACSPLTNAAAVAGKLALVDRGACTFVVKAKNAQDAGAIALLVADNVAGAPPAGLGGTDATITIPAVRITLADGNTIKAQLVAGVNATLGVDLNVLAGADPYGRLLMYTPAPFQGGSSVSHWDTIAFPNQLMEPAINADLPHSVRPPEDLTLPLMRDIGWYPDGDLDGITDVTDACLGSDLRETVVIGSCDSKVPNTFFTDGCTIADLVAKCADGATNHGNYQSCAAQTTQILFGQGWLKPGQQGAIRACAAKWTVN